MLYFRLSKNDKEMSFLRLLIEPRGVFTRPIIVSRYPKVEKTRARWA
jgi:hypothetical protein